MEEAIYQKIELFLNGEMSKEEALQFEKTIQENDELKSEVELYKAINSHTSESDDQNDVNSDYKRELHAYINSDEARAAEEKLLKVRKEYHANVEVTEPSKPKSKVIYFMVSTAAIIAFIIGVFIFQNDTSNDELYMKYYAAKELPSFTGRSSEESSVLNLAIEKFNEIDYTSSLSNFNKYLTESEKINPLVYIYTGLIQSELGNLNEAISELEKLEKMKIEDSSRALWYKALIYLKFEKENEAKLVLEIIVKNDTYYKNKEAKELYGEL